MSTTKSARPEQNARRFTLCGVFTETKNNRSCLLLRDASGADRFWLLPYALEHADEIDGLGWMEVEIREDRIRLSEADAKIWAARGAARGELVTAALHCRIGDLVEFDCPNVPEDHGRKARVIGPAGFNGLDWWELELLNEFVVMPDPEHVGGHVLVRQSFAPDARLKPIAEAHITNTVPVAGDAFYVVDSRGFIYGPPMTIEAARLKASDHERTRGGAQIVLAATLEETVAGAREL